MITAGHAFMLAGATGLTGITKLIGGSNTKIARVLGCWKITPFDFWCVQACGKLCLL